MVTAIEFLSKYNKHYQNIQVHKPTLDSYKEKHTFPIQYLQANSCTNATLEPAVTELSTVEEKDGMSFVLCCVTADDISQLSAAKRKVHAINHIKNSGQVLGIGHSATLESLWNNPETWEKLFPHLYPFGIGGPRNLRNQDYVSTN